MTSGFHRAGAEGCAGPAFDREAMLQRAKKRGGTASMIVCAVSNDLKNSDLRADNPAIMRAFNERFELLESQRDGMLETLKFILDHIADPERSYRDLYPAFGLDSTRAIEMTRAAVALADASEKVA